MLIAMIPWPCRCMRPSWQTSGLQQRSWASGRSSPTPRQHQQGWWLVHDCQQPCSRVQPGSRLGTSVRRCCHMLSLLTCSHAAKSASSWSGASIDVQPFPEQLHIWRNSLPTSRCSCSTTLNPQQQAPHHLCLRINTPKLTASSGVQQQV